jgi:hypothetical protein
MLEEKLGKSRSRFLNDLEIRYASAVIAHKGDTMEKEF